MVTRLPGRRPDRRRRPHAGVPLRARDRPRDRATTQRSIDYPVAVDNDYEIWSAFANRYWPALYFVDRDGIIAGQHFGEGRYEQSERLIQRLLFRVLLDGEAPDRSHGVDVDVDGHGVLDGGRLYQLVRQHAAVRERTLEITFLAPGAEAYAFTFG